MSDLLDTVKVKRGDDYAIINAKDLTEADELYEDPPADPPIEEDATKKQKPKG